MNKIVFLIIGIILFPVCFLRARQPNPSDRRLLQDERFRNLTRPRILPRNLLRLQTTIVPPLEGREFNSGQISSELEKLRLVLGDVVEKADNTMAGRIIQQDPAPDSQVLVGTRVNLVVAVQVPAEPFQTVDVPGVTGFQVEQARQIISASRLQPGEVVRLPSDQQEGLVIRQFPEEGTQVDPGTPIHLYVSEGRQITEVYVPDLIRQPLERAAGLLEGNNLRAGILREEFSEGPEGIILSQFPPPGTLVIPGTTVDIVYSVNRRIPDVTGRPLDEAVEFLRSVDLYVAVVVDRESGGPGGIVLDQSPPAGSVYMPGTEMKLVQSVPAAALPPWIYWGAGIVVIGAGGSILVRKIRQKKKRNVHGEDTGYKLKLIPDPGKQVLETQEEKEALSGITFRLIEDKGIQTIEN